MLELGSNYFGISDYVLLGATLLISLLIGLYYGYTNKNTNEELLMGGRNMSIFPVAASVMVTYLSAITIIGFPSEIYAHGSQIFLMHLVAAVGISISPFIFVPFFYPMKLTSINEYLERRFNSMWIRWLASGIFIFQQLLLNGVVLYAPSIVLEAFMGFPIWMSILGMGTCATVYTTIGGIKAVVWTDAFQFIMMLSGMVAIVLRGISASGGFLNVLNVAGSRGRLHFFDFAFDPFTRHNFWNFLLGTGLHALMQPGVHQLQVQRYSGMPTIGKAKKAIVGSVPLKLLLMTLCLLTGISIFAFYANCDPLTKGNIKQFDQIVPYFVVHELSEIPGMMGLFTSCVLSANLSSLSSALNSLAAVTWEDFLVRQKYFREMSPKAQTNMTRLSGVFYGVLCVALAFTAQKMGSVYNASMSVVYAVAGVLYGIFLMGLFMPFLNDVGAITGALTSFICMLTISVVAFINKKASKPSLSLSVEGCSTEQLGHYYNFSTLAPVYETTPPISTDDWPWKLFQLSYLLYPVAGTIICMVVGVLTSFLTYVCVPRYRKEKPHFSLVHPIVRPITRWCTARDTYQCDAHDKEQKLSHFVPMTEKTN